MLSCFTPSFFKRLDSSRDVTSLFRLVMAVFDMKHNVFPDKFKCLIWLEDTSFKLVKHARYGYPWLIEVPFSLLPALLGWGGLRHDR